jgi:hypothetical protein
MIKRTERGWAGHFCGSHNCKFRRNTLLEGDKKIVVSTVGGYYPKEDLETIGHNRYYETMAFHAIKEGVYIDANVWDQIDFDSNWAICYDSEHDIPDDIDNLADQMHETVVNELIGKMQEGVI